ncbi:MAG: hypothetical protein RLZZ210_1322 [Pseudomonadota bacterium]|jgi:hypothetical protein
MTKNAVKAILISLGLGIITSGNAFAAPDAAKKTAIDSLFNTMGISKMAEGMAGRLKEDVKLGVSNVLEGALIVDKKLTPEQKKALVPKLEKSIPVLQAKVGGVFDTPEFKKAFIEEQTAQYDKVYSTQDIQAINTFFQTETGKKFLTEQGKVAQATIQNLQNKYMPIAIEDLKKSAIQEVNKAAASK